MVLILDLGMRLGYHVQVHSRKMNYVPGWNLCVSNLMLTSPTFANEIMAKFIKKRHHHGT